MNSVRSVGPRRRRPGPYSVKNARSAISRLGWDQGIPSRGVGCRWHIFVDVNSGAGIVRVGVEIFRWSAPFAVGRTVCSGDRNDGGVIPDHASRVFRTHPRGTLVPAMAD